MKDVLLCSSLLKTYRESGTTGTGGEKLSLLLEGDRDVYNITAPFRDGDVEIIAGRVESRDSEMSEVLFFVQRDREWEVATGFAQFPLQDPFVSRVNGELIFGGVRVITDPNDPERIVSWVTDFYRGASVRELRHFVTGPAGMKDIRLVELPDGQVGVFTRPSGVVGGRGQIGYTTVPNLDDLTAQQMTDAPLIDSQFHPDEWGGSNEAHRLKNGMVGVLGHIAMFGENNSKHYYPITFVLNPHTLETSGMKIIAERIDFPEGSAKSPDLTDVLFSGGILRRDDGMAELYVGVSDAEAHRIVVPDPFLEYEV